MPNIKSIARFLNKFIHNWWKHQIWTREEFQLVPVVLVLGYALSAWVLLKRIRNIYAEHKVD